MTRQALADALSTVPGVSGHTAQPAAPVPGQGWPSWVRTEYTTTSCGPVPDRTDWTVSLLLPALDPAAGDAIRDTVAAALGTVGTVAAAEPGEVELQQDRPAVPSIEYEVTINERGQ